MNTKNYCMLTGMIAGLTLSGAAAATSISFYMTESNKPSHFASGADYLQVTIDDQGNPNDKIYFEVTPLPALTSITGTDIGIDKFIFNGPALSQSNIEDLSGWTIRNNKNDPHNFGTFSNILKSDGSSDGTLPFTFSIDAEGDSVNTYAAALGDNSTFFAARITGFSIGCARRDPYNDEASQCSGVNRAYFGGSALVPPTAVPIPPSAWLFVSGLLGMVGVSRRKVKS